MNVDEHIKAYLNQKVDVNINYNNDTGKWLYAVEVLNTDFWLDAFESKDLADEFCNKYGLRKDFKHDFRRS